MALSVPLDASPDEVREALRPLRNPVTVAVMSLGNAFAAGAIVRVAHSFLVDEVLFVGTEPHYPKASMGMEKYERIRRLTDLSDLVAGLSGRPLFAVEREHATRSLYDAAPFPEGVVFLFGSERFGLPPAALERADAVVGIPMYGVNQSFPVAVAAGMVLGEWARRRYRPGVVLGGETGLRLGAKVASLGYEHRMRLASSVFASASQTAGRPRWVKRLGRGLVTAGSLYSAVCLAAWLLYPRLLYPAPRRAVVAPEELPPGCEELTLPAEAGAPPVRALRWRAAGASLPTLVWFHGNGEIVDDLLPLGALYASEGLGFVAMEYRGYGRSAGSKATELGLYADAERLLRALEREREERSARGESTSGPLVVVGYSLGSAIAAELGARGRGDRYVLVAAFTSITDVASRIAPILPARLILSERFDTLAKAPHLRSPLLIHGADDELVPIDMGRAVAAASGARFVAVPSGRHGTVLVVGGGAALREISTFARAAVRAAP